ncbi:hypothetical protein MMC25_007505 [Agyrium rufum]|nr:hypothetical protein [Agyrium rufum]
MDLFDGWEARAGYTFVSQHANRRDSTNPRARKSPTPAKNVELISFSYLTSPAFDWDIQMKFIGVGAAIGALVLHASLVCAKHSHNHLDTLERRHQHHKREKHVSKAEVGEVIELRSTEVLVAKRGGQCQFPTDAGLVAVTPDQQNAGWAMSPNQPCTPGMYCPFACPAGMVMNQWNPDATSYTYPQSMDGGLYCDDNGDISKPFPDQDYCVTGSTNIGAMNKAGDVVAFCQTVLPGNEAMLIPTSVEDWIQLAMPGPSYWCSTAAHFYINPPGYGCDEACVWGSSSDPIGNWAPYVAGGNTVSNGETFIKLGWNPIYLEPATPFRNEMPTWGVEIVCDGPGCNGLPCAIDPGTNGVNEMVGANTDGAGGAAFCVVTVPEGVNANFVVFQGSLADAGSTSGAGGGGDSSGSSSSPASSSSSPPSSAAESSSATPSTSAPLSSSSSTAPSLTSTPESTSSSAADSATASSSAPSSTDAKSSASTSSASKLVSTSSLSSATSYPTIQYSPHNLLQNVTSTASGTGTIASTPVGTAVGTQTTPFSVVTGGGSGSASAGAAATTSATTGGGAGMHITAAGLGLSALAAVMVIAF